jgi:bifunctional ADP-heptose synthase (sugar kinase/adenylyltransferase)
MITPRITPMAMLPTSTMSGAGDAFLSGLMTGLLQGKDWAESTRITNACGAIVVSRHACSAAMPTPAEPEHWFSGSRWSCRGRARCASTARARWAPR